MRTMLQNIRAFWLSMTGQEPSVRETAISEPVLHDPAAQRPHDLDDPYFDPKVQRRVGEMIAKSALEKRN